MTLNMLYRADMCKVSHLFGGEADWRLMSPISVLLCHMVFSLPVLLPFQDSSMGVEVFPLTSRINVMIAAVLLSLCKTIFNNIVSLMGF